MERTAEKCYVSADRLAACQTGDGLVYHRLENGSGEVFAGCTVIDERLDIGLCEHTAARCNSI